MRYLYIFISALPLSAYSTRGTTCPKPIEEFITNLYTNYVFNYGELDSIADNFSPAVLDSLHKAYVNEYDGEFDEDDTGYAVWLFRTGQNGDFLQSLDSIKVDGNDLYTVYITEGDIPCTCQMHIVLKDGNPVLLGFNTEYDDPSQDISRRLLSIEDLEGEWRVIAVDNEGITYTEVKITFDTKEKTFGLYAGCNQIGGQIAQLDRSADAIRFENICMTQMACGEEIEQLERQLAIALDKVRSFYGIGEDIYMSDENDNVVLHINKTVDVLRCYEKSK